MSVENRMYPLKVVGDCPAEQDTVRKLLSRRMEAFLRRQYMITMYLTSASA